MRRHCQIARHDVYFTFSLIRRIDGATCFNYSAFLSYLCTFICQRAVHSENLSSTMRSKLGYSFLTSFEISNKWMMKKFLGVFPTHVMIWLMYVHDFYIWLDSMYYVQLCMGWFEIHVRLSQYRFSYHQFV